MVKDRRAASMRDHACSIVLDRVQTTQIDNEDTSCHKHTRSSCNNGDERNTRENTGGGRRATLNEAMGEPQHQLAGHTADEDGQPMPWVKQNRRLHCAIVFQITEQCNMKLSRGSNVPCATFLRAPQQQQRGQLPPTRQQPKFVFSSWFSAAVGCRFSWRTSATLWKGRLEL